MRLLSTYLGLAFLILLFSCGTEDEPVHVEIRLKDFALEAGGGESPGFINRLAGGALHFVKGEEVYSLNYRNPDSMFIELPVGTYTLKSAFEDASIYGQGLASYRIPEQDITIAEGSGVLPLGVEATCSLVLVDDPDQNLQDGPYFIERHSFADGYFIAYPMEFDAASGLWYAYFSPDPVPDDPSAFIWLFAGAPGDEEGGVPTAGLEIGKLYKVSVLE